MFRFESAARLVLTLGSLLSLFGCYPRIAPTGPVLSDLQSFLATAESPALQYERYEPSNLPPALPFRMWGVDFAEEMLFEFADDLRYAMVEICRVRKRGGQWTWFALVAEHAGRQHVAVGSDADLRLGLSFPAPVYRTELVVERVVVGKRVAYRFSFLLPDGRALEGEIQAREHGSRPGAGQRNGSAMNHSQETALAIIDLEEFSWARAEVRIDGVQARVRKLAPGLPYAMRLEQVAGGLAAGFLSLRREPDDGALLLRQGQGDSAEEIAIAETWKDEQLVLAGAGELLDFEYRFRAGSGASGPLELQAASLRHGEVEVLALEFSPPIPDLRYLQLGEYRGRFAAGLHGRSGYMAGEYRLLMGAEAVFDLIPGAPFWACERPIRSKLTVSGEELITLSEVAPELARGGRGSERCFAKR